MIPRECDCGHMMLEHEYNGRCLVTICSCMHYEEKLARPDARSSDKRSDPSTADQ